MHNHDTEQFYPKNKLQWRKWLEKNHQKKTAVWVLMYNKLSGKPSISWSDAVDEALCFGWIDSLKKKLDVDSSIQFFSKRKSQSTWSKINKDKVERLVAEGFMQPAGLESIAIAKENGSWKMLEDVDNLIIPDDLAKAFKKQKGSKERFESLSKSLKKIHLQSLLFSKRPETRQKRILTILSSLEEK